MTTALSRRTLLSRAAAGAAGVAFTSVATHAFADDSAGKPAATLRWGIIGTGSRGSTVHVTCIEQAPESALVALCDISQERLSATAAKVSRLVEPVATYTDYQKLLADPRVNAVVICTPNLFHREMLLAAIQAGKHVFCEKPCGTTVAEANEMQRAAVASKTAVMFGMQYRNNAKNQKMGQVIKAGDIGKPRYMVQNCSRGDWNLSPNVWQYADPKLGGGPRNWRFSHTATGGTLNEFDCHYFDILHWFAGSAPSSATCEGGISVYKDGRDTWDHASVTLRYPNDVTAVHTLCIFGPQRADLTVVGDEGAIESIGETLRLTGRGRRAKANAQDLTPPAQPRRQGGADRATLGLYEDFLTCVKTGKKPDAGIDRAITASKTCWLSELAAQRRAEVKWEELG